MIINEYQTVEYADLWLEERDNYLRAQLCL